MVAFVEQDEYCQKVLKKHWADVPIINDIRDYRHGDVSNTESSRNKRKNRDLEEKESEIQGEIKPKLIDDSKITEGTQGSGEWRKTDRGFNLEGYEISTILIYFQALAVLPMPQGRYGGVTTMWLLLLNRMNTARKC